MTDAARKIFPRPRELEVGGPGPPPEAAARFVRDGALPEQGYAILADASGIRVSHADAAGRRYGAESLEQCRRALGARLPGLRLRDWPDFADRGYLLDISRDRVPTQETLERLVERLARLRFNHLELYTEHSFAYPGHESVWRGSSPITPAELRWLDALCAKSGIELAANQNTFGHMERWLRHAAYRERAEAPEGWRPPRGARRRPSVLAPTEANARFALELVREQCRHVSSRRVNIGCDETFELGSGRSRAEVEARGRAEVYFEHLLRLLRGLHAEDHEVLFWADILRSQPELVARLPAADTIALVWHYEAPDAAATLPPAARELLAGYGLEARALEGFSAQVGAFAEHGVPFWVCPGTSCWNSLVGRLSNARANLRDAARVGLEHGATGYLVTDWGDNGHLQPPAVSLAPLLDAAGQAWNGALHDDLDLASGLDAWLFGEGAEGLGEACVGMGEVYAKTGLVGFNASPLHAELVGGSPLGALGEPDAAAAGLVAEELEHWRERVGRARPSCVDGDLVVRELSQALRLARHAAWRLGRRAGATAPEPATLRADLAEAIDEQRACWLERARPGGLDDSVARLERRLLEYTG